MPDGIISASCVLFCWYIQIYKLAQETIILLLEFNPDAQALLDWVIDRCYTGPHEVADGCFNALARVFSNRSEMKQPCKLLPLEH